jgi:hypothetical protein
MKWRSTKVTAAGDVLVIDEMADVAAPRRLRPSNWRGWAPRSSY